MKTTLRLPMTNKKKAMWLVGVPLVILGTSLFTSAALGIVARQNAAAGSGVSFHDTIIFINLLTTVAVVMLVPCAIIGLIYFFKKDKAPEESIIAALPENQRPHPWRRYFARTLDMWLLGMLLGVVILLALPAPNAIETADELLGLIVALIILPIEALFLSKWGKTPGKWMFGVNVTKDGKLLTFEQALQRAFNVWMRGMGFGISFIAFFSNIHQYSTLMSKGIVSWDKDMGLTVTYDKPNYARIFLAVLVLLGFALLTIVTSVEIN